MSITISSVVSTCILSSVMILLICPVLKNNFVICRAGPRCIILILMCLVIRMLFPVELWFAYSIRIEHVLPFVRSILNREIIWNSDAILIWDILIYIWAAGIAYQLGKKFFICRKLKRLIRLLPSESLSEFLKENGLDEPEDYKDADVRISVAEFVKSPCLTGIRTGVILLPKLDYMPEELFYIIRHEMMHYKNKDVYKKLMADILCTVFWWNPVFVYLQKTIFHLIEISNDRVLTKDMTGEEKTSYMECLVNVAEKINKQDIPFGVSFSKGAFRELKQRLVLIEEETEGNTLFRKGLVFQMAVLFGLSFFIILEAFTKASEGIPMTPENTYLIQNDGVYDVYFDGEYIFSTDDLTPFPGVEIYENKEENSNE